MVVLMTTQQFFIRTSQQLIIDGSKRNKKEGKPLACQINGGTEDQQC